MGSRLLYELSPCSIHNVKLECSFRSQGSYANKKRRSLPSDMEEIRTSIGESIRPQRDVFNAENKATMKARRDVNVAKRSPIAKLPSKLPAKKKVDQKPDSDDAPWDKKRRSVDDNVKTPRRLTRHRRDLTSSENNLSDGALKMAARSDDIDDIEKGLQGLERIAKRDSIPEEEKAKEVGTLE